MARPARPARLGPRDRPLPAAPPAAPLAAGASPGPAAGPLSDARTVALAAALSLLTSGLLFGETRESSALLVVDQVVAGLACAALWLRRRWPAQLAAGVVVVGVFSHFMAGPIVVALFTAAARCRVRTVVGLVGVSVAAMPLSLALRPESELPGGAVALTQLLMLAAVVGWGLFARYRRELAASLYQQAQRSTREAVAREMHDVLAHRLSLLSVHAGALEYRPDAPPEQIRQAAGVIRDSAHTALEELREVIGVLRADPTAEPEAESVAAEGGRPQPTYADLPRLAEESRRAGTPVALRDRVRSNREVPEVAGRTAYRVVQEGLTNARKHAPRSPARVTVRGGPGEGLTVEVRTPLPAPAPPGAGAGDGPGAPIPGGGLGLVGLAERVALAGGRLEHGPTGDDFRLWAWLPWRT